MTRDDIIRMAQEADLLLFAEFWPDDFKGLMGCAERFAALVAAAEREACAKVCDEMEQKAEGTECCKWPTPADCAYAIRARGQS